MVVGEIAVGLERMLQRLLRFRRLTGDDLAPGERLPGADVRGHVLRSFLQFVLCRVKASAQQVGQSLADPGAPARRAAFQRLVEILDGCGRILLRERLRSKDGEGVRSPAAHPRYPTSCSRLYSASD